MLLCPDHRSGDGSLTQAKSPPEISGRFNPPIGHAVAVIQHEPARETSTERLRRVIDELKRPDTRCLALCHRCWLRLLAVVLLIFNRTHAYCSTRGVRNVGVNFFAKAHALLPGSPRWWKNCDRRAGDSRRLASRPAASRFCVRLRARLLQTPRGRRRLAVSQMPRARLCEQASRPNDPGAESDPVSSPKAWCRPDSVCAAAGESAAGSQALAPGTRDQETRRAPARACSRRRGGGARTAAWPIPKLSLMLLLAASPSRLPLSVLACRKKRFVRF